MASAHLALDKSLLHQAASDFQQLMAALKDSALQPA